MRAVVSRGRGDYSIENVPVPQLPEGGLILKVEACGVCAGDIKCFEGGARFWGGDGNPSYCEPPFIPGHEIVGRVFETDNPEYKLGERLTVEQIVPCGTCRYCREGKYTLCGPHDVFGFKNYLNGGFAEYVAIPKRAIPHRVPDSLSLEQAALIEPYACGMHAVDRAQIGPDDVVAIAGAGTLGLSMITAAKAVRPRAIISLEPAERLQALAKRMGADYVMGAWKKETLPEFISDMTDGAGVDVYIEASGHVDAISQGLNLIKKGGRFVEFSVFGKPATIDWSIIGDAKELDLLGVSLSPNCFSRVIDGMKNGTLKTEGVVTHKLPLEDFARAFELSKTRESVKAVLVP